MPSARAELAFRRALPRPTDRVRLGRHLSVSPICVGMVRDPRTIPAAFDAGVNFFLFSADMHWPRYEAHRRGLSMLLERRRSIRDQIVVAVVSYVTQPEFCSAPFREAIEAVPKLGRVDVVVAGGSYRADISARLEVYAKHLSAPIEARAVAASFHDRRAAADALEGELVDLAFCRYNALHRGAEVDLFPVRRRGQKARLFTFKSQFGWLPPSRLAQLGVPKDVWRPKRTDHYRFALAPQVVDGLLCAPQTPAQVRALVDALSEGALTTEELQHIRDLAALELGTASLA